MRLGRGFSLLEMLVALAIMGLSLGVLYRMAGGSARTAADIDVQQQALWLAQSVLASRSSVPPEGWNEDGRSGVFAWQVRSSPFAAATGANAVPLHQIALHITWGGSARDGALDLSTVLPEQPRRPGEGL
ncbi:MAG: hypothetical protein OHK0048_03720 [Rhodoferax sp.]